MEMGFPGVSSVQLWAGVEGEELRPQGGGSDREGVPVSLAQCLSGPCEHGTEATRAQFPRREDGGQGKAGAEREVRLDWTV